nr:hypothetical protein [Tanacetum cinerariifolium]
MAEVKPTNLWWRYFTNTYAIHRRSGAEDREFARQMNRFHGEMICACEDTLSFVQELESLSGVVLTTQMAEFLNKTMAKDDGRMLQLHNLEREAEEWVIEKEHFS